MRANNYGDDKYYARNTAWVFNNRDIYETGSLDLLEIIGLVLFRGMLLTTKSKI